MVLYKLRPMSWTKENTFLVGKKNTTQSSYGKIFERYEVLHKVMDGVKLDKTGLKGLEYNIGELRECSILEN